MGQLYLARLAALKNSALYINREQEDFLGEVCATGHALHLLKSQRNANNARHMATGNHRPETTKPGSGQNRHSGLHGRYKTGAVFRGQGGCGPCRWKQRLLPLVPQAKIKSKCHQPMESKALARICFPFPLASTCDVQADSLYLCS